MLSDLDEQLERRLEQLPEGSYSARLFRDENLRVKKLGEEHAELLKALLTGSEDECASEAADLIFHLAVALRARGVSMHRVLQVLEQRHRPEKQRD